MSAVLRCEISGELATYSNNPEDRMVVTPSGHIAKRRLLLMKLAENRGMDPFVSSLKDDGDGRPLSESELIELKISSAEACIIPPRLPQYNTITDTLKVLQQEYDALLLELFDTRKALQETRQELSQALYQNDASIRVIARLVMERDNAQNMLLQYTGNNGNSIIPDTTTTDSVTDKDSNHNEPVKKKIRTELPQREEGQLNQESNTIPEIDLEVMLGTWQELHSTRKSRQKIASKQAISLEVLKNNFTDIFTNIGATWNATTSENVAGINRLVSLHDTTNNLVALTKNRIALLSTKDNSILEDTISDLPESSSPSLQITCVESLINDGSCYAIGLSNSTIALYHNQAMKTLIDLPSFPDNDNIIDVRLHPDGMHIVTATLRGRVCIGRLNQEDASLFQWISIFKQHSGTNDETTNILYSTGALHPDGLIYIAGTTEGLLDIWDFKSQTCADSLKHEIAVGSLVKAINISSNGYHVAVAYSNDTILVWDLRKLNVIATLNHSTNALCNVSCIEFDNAGKYLAFAGINTVDDQKVLSTYITTVKDWGETAILQVSTPTKDNVQITGLAWGFNNKITLIWDSWSQAENDDTASYRRNIVLFGEK